MARTRGAASRDAGSLYAKTRSIVVAAARRLGDRDDARCAVAVSALLCAFELVFCVAIVRVVPYTEIDWRAYMDEVGGFLRASATTPSSRATPALWCTPPGSCTCTPS